MRFNGRAEMLIYFVAGKWQVSAKCINSEYHVIQNDALCKCDTGQGSGVSCHM
jgi:hypothetical protein